MMEFHVHLGMLFWLQSGKVDCWEFNQGFEKSNLEGPSQRKTVKEQLDFFKSSRGPSKINAPS